MDKYEYKLRADEIKSLIANKKYAEAMKIADSIDWNRVKSVMMLTMVSDLYKINRKYDVSRDILLLAYDHHPSGRTIIYSLCELSIKMEDFVQAVEYYKEFVKIAPKDTGRYILQYKLYEAQEVSLEEIISVLEEFKKRDYREKWAYELAYLYHRIGLSTKCVEECDEIVLWFGEGKYVTKAMELKLLHEPLTPSQQEKYQNRNKKKMTSGPNSPVSQSAVDGQDALSASTMKLPTNELDFEVKTYEADNKYNTINIQEHLAASMADLMAVPEIEQRVTNAIIAPMLEKTYDMSEKKVQQALQNEVDRVFEEDDDEVIEEKLLEEPVMEEPVIKILTPVRETPVRETPIVKASGEIQEILFDDSEEEISEELSTTEKLTQGQQAIFDDSKSGFEDILSQEYDGQISLVVPEAEQLEKQITGQMNIEEILVEWEKMKKNLEDKRVEGVKARVLQQTGDMFSQFDAATRTGVLAQLEEAALMQAVKEKELAAIEEENIDEMNIDEMEMEDMDLESEEDVLREEELLDELPEVEELEEIEEYSEEDDFVEETFQEEMEDLADENQFDAEDLEESMPEIIAVPICVTRELTEEEIELFGSMIETEHLKSQVAEAIDCISLASYTGNVIVTGEEGSGTLLLAKNLIKVVQQSDGNFSGKVARITGIALNTKKIPGTLNKLKNGAVIIEKANGLSAESLVQLNKYLEQENNGIIVVLEDTKSEIRKLLKKNNNIACNFNARIDIAEMDNDCLVNYGKEYALEQEYSIDELGVLALYTRIADKQSGDYFVTLEEVRKIIDEAIWSANRKNIRHFVDILIAKRYDDEDMIVLREKDFIC